MWYVVLYIIILVLSILSLKIKKIDKVIIGILILFSGFRYGIGKDYYNYSYIFNQIRDGQNFVNLNIEYGYLLLNKIIVILKGNFQWVILITASLQNILIYKFIKKESLRIIFSINIYFLLGNYYISTFNAIRQSIAIALFLLSYSYLKRKKILKTIICFLFGGVFHKSLLFLLPVLLILNIKKISNKIFFISLILLTLIIPKIDYFISLVPVYAGYVNRVYDFNTNYLILFAFFILNIIFIAFNKKIKFSKLDYNIIITCTLVIYTILINRKYNEGLNLILMRMCAYFYYFYIIFIPKAIIYFEKKINKRNILFILFYIILSLLYFKTTFFKLGVYRISSNF